MWTQHSRDDNSTIKLPPVHHNRHSTTTTTTSAMKHSNSLVHHSYPNPYVHSHITSDTLQKLDYLSEKPFAKGGRGGIIDSDNVYNSVFQASGLDDILLKKTLSEAFESDPTSYLGSLKDAALKYSNPNTVMQNIPKTLIPKEYFIYSRSPLHQGLGKITNDDQVGFNEEVGQWEKLIFPSHKPVRRAEVYLLAKTMDDMLLAAKEIDTIAKTENEFHIVTVERLSKTFKAHVSALYEVSRQIFITCVERGLLLQKIYLYFVEFFDQSLAIIQRERKKCADFQDITSEYEKLIHDMSQEKEKARTEMEELMKENK
jgi:hypothetical protein